MLVYRRCREVTLVSILESYLPNFENQEHPEINNFPSVPSESINIIGSRNYNKESMLI